MLPVFMLDADSWNYQLYFNDRNTYTLREQRWDGFPQSGSTSTCVLPEERNGYLVLYTSFAHWQIISRLSLQGKPLLVVLTYYLSYFAANGEGSWIAIKKRGVKTSIGWIKQEVETVRKGKTWCQCKHFTYSVRSHFGLLCKELVLMLHQNNSRSMWVYSGYSD